MLKRKWNSERPPVFAHLVLSKILGACKARENLARIDCLLDLWERGIHTGLAGHTLAEVRDRDGRIERRK